MKPPQKSPIVPPPPVSETDVAPLSAPTTLAPETPVSRYPDGVQMHDTGAMPYTSDRAERLNTGDPEKAPPGWQGSYRSCGVCGKFLGNETRCPKCAPEVVPGNVHNMTETKRA